MARRRKATEREQALQFAAMWPVVLGIVAVLAWWRDHDLLALRLLCAGPVICLFALLLPGVWLRLFRWWMKLAAGMSWVMTRVILSVFFYAILTPYGLLIRAFGKRPIDLSWPDSADAGDSYWVDREPVERTIERYRKQY